MFPRKIIKGLLIPSYAGVGVVNAKSDQDHKEDCDDTKKLIRPRNLPLYVEPPKCVTCSNTIDDDEGFLLTTIRCARQELQSIYEQAKVIQGEVENLADEAHRNTKDVVDYLRQEENLLPRLGAIGLGSFAGYLLACRRGFFRKVLYSVAGATAVTAIAYPTLSKEYGEMFLCEFKKGVVIGYHFLNGAPIDYKKLQNIEPPCIKVKGGEEHKKKEEANENMDKPKESRNRPSDSSKTFGGGESKDDGLADVCPRPRSRRREKTYQRSQEEFGTPNVQPKSGMKTPSCEGQTSSGQRSPSNRSLQPQSVEATPCPKQESVRSVQSQGPQREGSQSSSDRYCADSPTARSITPLEPSNWTQSCGSNEYSQPAQGSSSAEPKQRRMQPSNSRYGSPCKSVVKRSSVEVTYPEAPGSEECTVSYPEQKEPRPCSREKTTTAKVSASIARTHLEARLLKNDGVASCRCRHEPFR